MSPLRLVLRGSLAAFALSLAIPVVAQPGSVDTLQRAFAGGGGGRQSDFPIRQKALREAAKGDARALVALTLPKAKPVADDFDELALHAAAQLIMGRRETALKVAREAERLIPEVWGGSYYPHRFAILADVFVHAGSNAEAVRLLRRLVEHFDSDNAPQAKLAELLATVPEVNLRNGKEALVLAAKACRVSNFRDLRCASAYAAAAAENGQFDEAVRRQTVIAGKSRDGRDWVAEEVAEARERLAAYQARKPWRLWPSAGALAPHLRRLAGDS